MCAHCFCFCVNRGSLQLRVHVVHAGPCGDGDGSGAASDAHRCIPGDGGRNAACLTYVGKEGRKAHGVFSPWAGLVGSMGSGWGASHGVVRLALDRCRGGEGLASCVMNVVNLCSCLAEKSSKAACSMRMHAAPAPGSSSRAFASGAHGIRIACCALPAVLGC